MIQLTLVIISLSLLVFSLSLLAINRNLVKKARLEGAPAVQNSDDQFAAGKAQRKRRGRRRSANGKAARPDRSKAIV